MTKISFECAQSKRLEFSSVNVEAFISIDIQSEKHLQNNSLLLIKS